MKIRTDYKIVSLDQDNKNMMIQFSLTGHSTINMLIPIPESGVILEEYLVNFLPTTAWGLQKRLSKEYLNVTEKESGSIYFDDALLVPAITNEILQNKKYEEFKTAELENAITKVLMKLESTTL